MKILCLLILCISTGFIHGQIIDTVQLRCSYHLSYAKNKQMPDYKKESFMTLEIGSHLSRFYNIESHTKDSLFHLDSQALSTNEILVNIGKYKCKQPKYNIYKNFPQKSMVSYTNKIVNDYFKYIDVSPDFKWKLLEKKKAVLGYECMSATCEYGGRLYIAWYTPEIPIPEGPWKFCQLPGLILEVYDADQEYHFSIHKIEKTKGQNINITHPSRDYLECSKQELIQTEIRYFNDPMGYINNTMGVTVSRMNGSAKSTQFIYNPIERLD